MQPHLVREAEVVDISTWEHKNLAGVSISLKKAGTAQVTAIRPQNPIPISLSLLDSLYFPPLLGQVQFSSIYL